MIEKGKEIVRAPYLKAGDRVALISPAYWVPEEVIMQAAEVLRGWGLQPVIGPHTTSLNVDAYSGTADERAADLLWALEDDAIKAIFCSRGGYGSMHLLNRIPLEKFRQHPKWLIGHGDISNHRDTLRSWSYGVPDRKPTGTNYHHHTQPADGYITAIHYSKQSV